MRWKVVWKQEAERRLTSVWLADRSRERISQAAHLMDEMLSLNPLNAGESRSGNRRIVFAPPLAAIVEVDSADHTARVLTLWRF